jgi:hypothetical protein
MVTSVELTTGVVVIVNVALVLPLATVTLAGTLAAVALSLLSCTTTPPVGAGPLNVTVPWEVDPPVTPVGIAASELNTGGLTASEAVLVTPP